MNFIFKNAALQKQFDTEGYIVIPFLNSGQVAQLKALYKKHFPSEPDAFYSSSFLNNADLKKQINEETDSVISENINNTFTNFKSLGSSFLSKPSGKTGIMPVHQDWTVVDESIFASVTAWIPLTDTFEKNGAIKVLSGSHLFSSAFRGPTIPSVFQHIENEILKRMTTLEMKAGEAFIFNHALLHASSENISGEERIALLTDCFTKKRSCVFIIKMNMKKLKSMK